MAIELELANQTVLITGGSGTFGHAFARYALDAGARKVIVFSRGEAKQAAMRAEFQDERMRFFVGDVRDPERIMDALRGVDICIHAAALKRVEVCEQDPDEAVLTNVVGTRNVARACIERGVSKAIFLSTDKAAAPNTHYGATKLCAERMWLAQNVYSAGTPTRFSATRYGNVIGSTGSVIPLWESQKHTGVITVTHAAMTRFFMSIVEAVELVALALEQMRGGEVFVPKIHATRITDLAQSVAPGCSFHFTGIRPGEKLHETLITEDEARSTYDMGTHYIIEPETRTWGDVLPLNYPLVPPGFTLRSDTAPQFSTSSLRKLAA
jgi:UDP-N-acetylglucosamine 4,6-dehydratase